MITRIVKMTYKTESIDDFKKIFEVSSKKIKASEGCISLKLLQHQEDPRIFFTYSIWKDESYLEKYRSADFFRGTWTKCKKLFDAKPEAWTTQVLYSSDHEEDTSREL